MTILLFVLTVIYILSQVGAYAALVWARRRSLRLNSQRAKLAAYPGVSIITSLKGPTPGVADSVQSLLKQDYPGPIEFVFSALDEKEPLIEVVKKVIQENPGSYTVKWIYPVEIGVNNPRTAKIDKAYENSIYPWVFMICVDTRFSSDYLRKAIELTDLNDTVYVTSFPVIDRPRTFIAKMEAVGLNVDVSQFFLLSSLSPKAACAYGGAFLFSRNLAEKSGAYKPLLKFLTDDITLAKSLSRVGGLCFLTDELAYVRQEELSFRSYWSRKVRWRMIGRYFIPELFWWSPLTWTQAYLLIGGILLQDSRIFVWLLFLSLSRVAVGIGIQLLLKTPRGDWRHAWVLPIYDWVAIPAWFFAAFGNRVAWGTNLMQLSRKGEIEGLVAKP